jgi:hypothetical protein
LQDFEGVPIEMPGFETGDVIEYAGDGVAGLLRVVEFAAFDELEDRYGGLAKDEGLIFVVEALPSDR